MNKSQVLKTLSINYSFDTSKECSLLRKGIDNDVYLFTSKTKKKIIARVGKRETSSSTKFETDLINILAKKKVKISHIVKTLSGKDFIELPNRRTITCFEFIDGKPYELRNNIPDKYLVKQAAVALGEFHQTTINLNLDSKGKRTIYSEFERVIKIEETIIKTLKDGKEFLENTKAILKEAKNKTVVQGIIHNDYNPSNVLFKNFKLEAIIDFDWSCSGPILIDVGHGAITWSTLEKETKPNIPTFNDFIETYKQNSPLKNFDNTDLYFWAAFSCLQLAANFISDSIADNKYKITRADQSGMYKRFKYYINKI